MKPTQQRLAELFDYNPDTGTFTRKVTRSNNARAGTVVGSPDKNGYLIVCIDGKYHKLHRLAFLYMTGVLPTKQVDHKNGEPADNRWSNLRQVTCSENQHNQVRAQGMHGLIGVGFNKRLCKFTAQISVGKKLRHLGLFATPESAHAAYLRAKDQLHPTHLRLKGA